MAKSRQGTLAEYVYALWLAICVGGALVPHALSASAVASILLVGLALLTYEKDQRYAHLSWPAALRTFHRTHEWSPLSVWATLFVTVYMLSRVSDSDPRGLCVLALAVSTLLWLGAPKHEHATVQAHPSSRDDAGPIQ